MNRTVINCRIQKKTSTVLAVSMLRRNWELNTKRPILFWVNLFLQTCQFECRSIHRSWSTLSWLSTGYQPSSNQILIKMLIDCWQAIDWDVHQVSIKMLIMCWMRVGSGYKLTLKSKPWMPLVHMIPITNSFIPPHYFLDPFVFIFQSTHPFSQQCQAKFYTHNPKIIKTYPYFLVTKAVYGEF